MTGLILSAAAFIGWFLLVRHRVRQLRNQPPQTPRRRQLFWAGNVIALGLISSMFYMMSLDHTAIPTAIWMLVCGFFLAGIAVVIAQRKFAD